MNAEVQALLCSDDPNEQQMGIGLLGNHPEHCAAEIMEALCQVRNLADSVLAAYCRRQFAFFGEPYRPSPRIDARAFEVGSDARRQEITFLEGVRGWLSTSRAAVARRLDIMAGQEALSCEYEELISSVLGEQHLMGFQERVDLRAREGEKQIGFAPTFRCNLGCSYCFAAGMEGEEADFEAVRLVCAWAAKAGVRKLRLYGGEPTQYSRFNDLVDEAKSHGLRVFMASNLIMAPDRLEAIQAGTVDVVMAHVRPRADSEDTAATFWENVSYLKASGVKVILRYNLADEDWTLLVNRAEKCGFDTVAFAPIVKRASTAARSREEWIKDAHLSRRFARYLLSRNIRPVLSRPQPLCCAWGDGTRDMRDVFTGQCSAHVNGFTFNVLLRPDLSVALCDGDLCDTRPGLQEFRTWEDLREYVEPRMLDWHEQSLFPECGNCYFKVRALCQGACLAAKPPLLNGSAGLTV